MAYTSAVFYLDFESGLDAVRTALLTCLASNPAGSIARINKTAHGLVTGAVVDLTLFTAWLNDAWKITVVDANNFDLDGAVWQATADNDGTVTPRGGSSKADAWKTIGLGATLSRHAAGDTLRLKASPDDTLVGNALWTDLSKDVTLPAVVTATVSNCETVWTASANVTPTADTAQFKEGTKSAKLVIAGAFTTGLVAYFPTGALDLSGYQQLSFWINNSAILAAATLSLRLCSDAAGATTVNTIAIPAIAQNTYWAALTVDLGAALGASINSIALYADLTPGAQTIQLDHIIACKASSLADSLTLTSIIGKVWNKSWVASTPYAANTIRRPTQPNRNGFCYKVTAGGGGNSGASEPTWPQEFGVTVVDGALTWTCLDLEDTWYPIQSISGTTLKIDNHVDCLGSAGRGYCGTTETVATYKREPIKLPFIANFNNTSPAQSTNRNGTDFLPITYTGGWNRTDMTTMDGETWLSTQGAWGSVINVAFPNTILTNVNASRGNYGVNWASSGAARLTNCHAIGARTQGFNFLSGSGIISAQNLVGNNGGGGGLISQSPIFNLKSVTCSGGLNDSGAAFNAPGFTGVVNNLSLKNNINLSGLSFPNARDIRILNLVSRANTFSSGLINAINGGVTLLNALAPDAIFSGTINSNNRSVFSHRHNQVADSHLITSDGGTIVSATDQRNTASGISWKFRPTNTTRGPNYPLRLSLAKIACLANTALNISIWTRRDNTNIKGQLFLQGGQLAGVPNDVTIACAPTINTWVQSGTLTVTPTEAGVIEVTFEVYDGVGTTNNFWVDDIVIS